MIVFCKRKPHMPSDARTKNIVLDNYASAEMAFLHLLRMQFRKNLYIPNDRPSGIEYITTSVTTVRREIYLITPLEEIIHMFVSAKVAFLHKFRLCKSKNSNIPYDRLLLKDFKTTRLPYHCISTVKKIPD